MTPKPRATALLASIALLLAGCAAPAATIPAGVTTSVYQNRFDYGLRQLELTVSNGTTVPITITRAAFESTRFSAPAIWDGAEPIPPGAARDLKVLLKEPVCGGGKPHDTVVLDFTLQDGRSGRATTVPSDEQSRLPTISDQDCLAASVATHAAISAAPALQWTPGSHRPAVLEISIEPARAPGTLTIRAVRGTVLLGLVDDAGGPANQRAVDLVIGPDAPASVIRLALVPARCDPHAIAEDKRGTFFPLDVSTSEGRSGTIYVPVSGAVRASLYAFFADYCGLP